MALGGGVTPVWMLEDEWQGIKDQPELRTRASVVVATHRRPEQLRRALLSVMGQTRNPLEVIVVADGPGDPAARIVAELTMQLLSIKYVELGRNWSKWIGHENRGAEPRQVGTMLARGDHVAYLNDDDEWLPHHLETALRELESRGADLVWCRARNDIGENKTKIMTCGIVAAARVFQRVQWKSWAAPDDYNFVLDAMRHGLRCEPVDEVTWTVN